MVYHSQSYFDNDTVIPYTSDRRNQRAETDVWREQIDAIPAVFPLAVGTSTSHGGIMWLVMRGTRAQTPDDALHQQTTIKRYSSKILSGPEPRSSPSHLSGVCLNWKALGMLVV